MDELRATMDECDGGNEGFWAGLYRIFGRDNKRLFALSLCTYSTILESA